MYMGMSLRSLTGGYSIIVVSIGRFLAFYVRFVPLEYMPTKPPRSFYTINIYFILFKMREGPQHLSSIFLNSEYTPVEHKRHEKHENDQWRQL